MVSREVREGENRVGFEIADLSTGGKGWLAQVSAESGPPIGRYRVNLEDLEEIRVTAVLYAMKNCIIRSH